MKRFSSILALLLLALLSSTGQPGENVFQPTYKAGDPLRLLFLSNPNIDRTKYTAYVAEIDGLTEKVTNKWSKHGQKRLLEKAFYFVQRKKLGWYENYVAFDEIFEAGKYDCLTGTALYAVLLDRLGISYRIYEFDFHLLLVAQVDGQRVLLESTDPFYGFVADGEEIDERLAYYASGGDSPGTDLRPVGKADGRGHIQNVVSLREVAGLQCFNLAVKAYNEGRVLDATQLIDRAHTLYPSERIRAIRQIFTTQELRLVSSN